MRILLLYDNLIRDYRGLLLLAEFLKQKGNKVWIKAGWDDPFTFCNVHKIQALVTGQIAESATHKYGEYCTEKNILLIINTSEPAVNEINFELLITFNTHHLNQDIIDLQTIGIYPHYKYILANNSINNSNKPKYKFLGFPRTDISFNKDLREIEAKYFENKYNLSRYEKKYLFLSSFLLDGAFDGVPEQDLKKWNYPEFQQRTMELLAHTTQILKRFIDEKLGRNDILIIKKHPWDCSGYFRDNFPSEKCLILDDNEFITTCLFAADCIMHTYSTSAFEAWTMGKPTVSIYLEKYLNIVPYHMRMERMAYDYESLITFIESGAAIPPYNNEELFSGTMDGKATFRLAGEINKLNPGKKYPSGFSITNLKKRYLSLQKYNDLDSGRFVYNPDTLAEKGTKYHDLLGWENQRFFVNGLYRKEINKFVNNFLKGESIRL